MKTYIIIGIVLIVLSGASTGLKETITHHWSKFEAKFPTANKQYWNPAISWTNKYEDYPESKKPRFFLSTSLLIFLTDAYHLFGELERDLKILGVALLTIGVFGMRWQWKVPIILAIAYITQGIGFHLIYTLYF